MCEIDLDYTFEFFREKQQKGRKPHRCNCCGRIIQAGEKYLYHFSVFEGEATMEKMCAECEADRAEFSYEHNGIIFAPSSFLGFLHDCVSKDPDDGPRWKPVIKAIQDRRSQVE